MPDTVRTSTDLLNNLFQDGQTAGITAQDMRDLIVSMKNPYGAYHFSTPAATTIGGAGTYVKAAGTTTTGLLYLMDANSVNNRLRYIGTTARPFLITCKMTVTMASGTNQNLGMRLYKYDDSGASGAAIDGSTNKTIVDGTDNVEISTGALVELDENDYVEIWITNLTNTVSPTVQLGELKAVGLFT